MPSVVKAMKGASKGINMCKRGNWDKKQKGIWKCGIHCIQSLQFRLFLVTVFYTKHLLFNTANHQGTLWQCHISNLISVYGKESFFKDRATDCNVNPYDLLSVPLLFPHTSYTTTPLLIRVLSRPWRDLFEYFLLGEKCNHLLSLKKHSCWILAHQSSIFGCLCLRNA